MKQQFVKNRRSGEFGYRLDTETGDAGGDGFDSVVGVKKTCKVELFKFSINIQTVYGFHISIIYGDTGHCYSHPENVMLFLKTFSDGIC